MSKPKYKIGQKVYILDHMRWDSSIRISSFVIENIEQVYSGKALKYQWEYDDLKRYPNGDWKSCTAVRSERFIYKTIEQAKNARVRIVKVIELERKIYKLQEKTPKCKLKCKQCSEKYNVLEKTRKENIRELKRELKLI